MGLEPLSIHLLPLVLVGFEGNVDARRAEHVPIDPVPGLGWRLEERGGVGIADHTVLKLAG